MSAVGGGEYGTAWWSVRLPAPAVRPKGYHVAEAEQGREAEQELRCDNRTGCLQCMARSGGRCGVWQAFFAVMQNVGGAAEHRMGVGL